MGNPTGPLLPSSPDTVQRCLPPCRHHSFPSVVLCRPAPEIDRYYISARRGDASASLHVLSRTEASSLYQLARSRRNPPSVARPFGLVCRLDCPNLLDPEYRHRAEACPMYLFTQHGLSRTKTLRERWAGQRCTSRRLRSCRRDSHSVRLLRRRRTTVNEFASFGKTGQSSPRNGARALDQNAQPLLEQPRLGEGRAAELSHPHRGAADEAPSPGGQRTRHIRVRPRPVASRHGRLSRTDPASVIATRGQEALLMDFYPSGPGSKWLYASWWEHQLRSRRRDEGEFALHHLVLKTPRACGPTDVELLNEERRSCAPEL
jgi:hypothetical protein